MKYIFFFSAFLFESISSDAQNYKAIYRYNFQVNKRILATNFMSPKLDSANIGYDFKSSKPLNNTSVNDSVVIAYFNEQRKQAFNESFRIICFCTPQVIKQQLVASNKVSDAATNEFIFKGSANFVFSYRTYIKSVFYRKTDADTVLKSCFGIDSSKLHAFYTGKKEQIGSWLCKEYKTPGDKDVSIWITDALPYYVNPIMPLIGLDGGIVRISFGGHKIELADIVKTDEAADTGILCDDAVKQSNPLEFQERYW